MSRALIAAAALISLVALALGSASADEPAPAPAAAPAAAPTSELDRVVDGLQKFYDSVGDFKASFKQAVKRKHLPRPLKKSGKVFFKRPGQMRWDYMQPERVLYVSDGEILWSYEPADKQVYKVNVKDSELYTALKFLFGQGNLRAEFDIALAPAGKGDEGLTGLELVPKVKQSNYKKLRLFVDAKTFEIRRTVLVDPLDNESRIDFSDISYEELKPEGFKFTPPPGARVQDLAQKAPQPGLPAPKEQ